MRPAIAFAAAVLIVVAVPLRARAQELPGGHSRVVTMAATPWDIYLACRAAGESGSTELVSLCSLRLPVISRGFTATELSGWRSVAEATPTPAIIQAARESAEKNLVKSARSVRTTSVGTLEFSFGGTTATLSSGEQHVLQRHATRVAETETDSQKIPVRGIADFRGNEPDSTTRALAWQRAEYIAGFLRRAGVPEDRLDIKVEFVRIPSNVDVPRGVRSASVGGTGSSLAASPAQAGGRAFGLTPTELAIGASDFLVERARAELETYVLRVGVNRLCAAPSWQRLLRATCGLLPLDGDSIRYVPGAPALQEALRTDLREMPYVVGEETLLKMVVRDNGSRASGASEVLERATMAMILVRYLRAVADGTEPLAALALWEGPTATLGRHMVPLPARLRQVATLARFAHSARTDLSSQLTGSALADTATLYVLKALLVHGASAGGTVWHQWMKDDNQRLNRMLVALSTAQRLAQEVEDDWKALRAVARDSAAAGRRAEIVSSLFSAAISIAAVDAGLTSTPADTAMRTRVLEPARDLVVALNSNDSRAASTSLVRLLQAGAESTAMRLPPEYTRLMGFANDAAQARTTDEFSSALENVVGAQGGYLAKRESTSRWYARVNAYVGGNVSGERTGEEGAGTSAAMGLAVPLGVEIGKAGPSRRSNGVFLQFIDLGAVASTRIGGDDQVESLPEFKLGSVVGPGIFWVHGYRDSPFASALGISYFPEGRQTEDGARVGAVRVSMMLAIDIPLFP
jgi:hypothetical protein